MSEPVSGQCYRPDCTRAATHGVQCGRHHAEMRRLTRLICG
jgi:hypothetical protein